MSRSVKNDPRYAKWRRIREAKDKKLRLKRLQRRPDYQLLIKSAETTMMGYAERYCPPEMFEQVMGELWLRLRPLAASWLSSPRPTVILAIHMAQGLMARLLARQNDFFNQLRPGRRRPRVYLRSTMDELAAPPTHGDV